MPSSDSVSLDPEQSDPLPSETEAACAEAAARSCDHVLLVGGDSVLRARVAHRIHELTLEEGSFPYQTNVYQTQSCRGRPASWVQEERQPNGTWRPGSLEIYLRTFATLHLADVESASNEVAEAIYDLQGRAFNQPDRWWARIIVSSAVPPEQWSHGPLSEAVQSHRWRRIDLGPATAQAGSGTGSDSAAGEKTEPSFDANADYTSVTRQSKNYTLSGRQSETVRVLHKAAKSGHPWVLKDSIAVDLGVDASSFRVRDAFRRKSEAYDALIEGDGKGRYRLKM